MIPKPKRQPKPKRAIRKKSKRKLKLHDADRLFSQFIRNRDAWQCKACGSPFSVQCAHIISRTYRAIRWAPDNAVTLCKGCHIRYTHRPLEWHDWVEWKFPGRYALLKAQALKPHAKPDYAEICSALKSAFGIREEL